MSQREYVRSKLVSDDDSCQEMSLPSTSLSGIQRPQSTAGILRNIRQSELTGVANASYVECEEIPEHSDPKNKDYPSGSASDRCQKDSVDNSKCQESSRQCLRRVNETAASSRDEEQPESVWSLPSGYDRVLGEPNHRCRHDLIPLQRRRLWFQRNWQALIQDRLTSNGLNPSDGPTFPDVELGQNTTSLRSPAITSRRCDNISSSSAAVGEATNVEFEKGFCQEVGDHSADQEGFRGSSCWIETRSQSPTPYGIISPQSSYSIGVFYSDTDRCKVRDGSKRPKGRGSSSSGDHHQYVTWKSSCEELRDMARPGQQDQDQPRRAPGRSRRRGNVPQQPAPTVLQTPDALATSTESVNNLQGSSDTSGNNTLPDILNSHLPPPYSTLPPSGGRRLPPPSHPPPPPPPLCGTGGPPGATVIPGPCPHSTPRRSSRGRGAFRGFPPRDRLRTSGRRALSFSAPAASESDEPKHCCGVMVTQTVSIRWFIVMIAFVGLCCAIVGTVLGALKATGREHLTVSLLMIGVGIVLITVSGIAWRLTSHDAPSCRAMLGLQASEQEPNRRFVPRVPPYGRPHHPYAAMMYPEFQYRPPPPSYQASMQEYRLRLLLLDRQGGNSNNTSNNPSTAVATVPAPGASSSSAQSPVSPPPTYRSQTSSSLHSRPPLAITERDYSRPPSYRSRASSAGVLRPSTETLASQPSGGGLTDPGLTTPVVTSHSRNPSLSLSFLSHESLFVDSSHSRMAPDSTTLTASDNPVHFTSPSGESQNSVVAGLSDESPTIPERHPVEHHQHRTGSWRRDIGRNVWAVRKLHDVNAVTIVQTTDSSQVLNQDTVILSIPGHDSRTDTMTSSAAGEVQILAHV